MTATQRHGDCEVVTTMRGRLAATCPYPNLSSATLSPDVALRFAEAEARRAVSEALAPREASPKLEAAERSLRKVAALDESQWDYPVKRDIGYSRQIASELDRIRATVARLEAENAALRGVAPARTALRRRGACKRQGPEHRSTSIEGSRGHPPMLARPATPVRW